MLKLKKLQAQQQAAKAKAANGDEKKDQKDGFKLKRSNSKELLESIRSKSKENVFSLQRGRRKVRRGAKTNPAELRAHKDVSEMEEIPGVVTDFPDANNLMQFYATVTPSDGLYKGASFKFNIKIPPSYPYDPPKVECETLIYHPNINWEGKVCLNILRADWMPVLNLGSVLFGLVTLFLEPNPDDPLNKEAAKLMIDKPSEFENNVRKSLRGGYVLGRQFPKLL